MNNPITEAIMAAVVCGGAHELNGQAQCIMCGFQECRICTGTGQIAYSHEGQSRTTPCFCQWSDNDMADMERGGDNQHDRDL